MDKLLPAIPITNKSVKNEPGISEILEIQSFQKTPDNNDININVEVTKYTSNPLNMNPFAAFAKTARTLDENYPSPGWPSFISKGIRTMILSKMKKTEFSHRSILILRRIPISG